MIYKAVEVIWIFLAGRAGGTGIEGTIRGPRGPKKWTPTLGLGEYIFFRYLHLIYNASYSDSLVCTLVTGLKFSCLFKLFV